MSGVEGSRRPILCLGGDFYLCTAQLGAIRDHVVYKPRTDPLAPAAFVNNQLFYQGYVSAMEEALPQPDCDHSLDGSRFLCHKSPKARIGQCLAELANKRRFLDNLHPHELLELGNQLIDLRTI
jgi:hypothetical protein